MSVFLSTYRHLSAFLHLPLTEGKTHNMIDNVGWRGVNGAPQNQGAIEKNAEHEKTIQRQGTSFFVQEGSE
jgi:hypothetical protein